MRVGAVNVKSALMVDGLSLTFMKIADGRLDPKDAYESEWIGGQGGNGPIRLGGDGTFVTGIQGKVNAKDLTGLGLLVGPQKLGPGYRPGIKSTLLAAAPAIRVRDAAEEGELLVGLELGARKVLQERRHSRSSAHLPRRER